jgi:hypothetical protein
MSPSLMLWVYSDHVDHSKGLVSVLLEDDEANSMVIGGGRHEGLGVRGDAVAPDSRGLSRPPVRAVEAVEDPGSEDSLEGREHRLPGEERQVYDGVEIGRREGSDDVVLRGSCGRLGHADAPFHVGEDDA